MLRLWCALLFAVSNPAILKVAKLEIYIELNDPMMEYDFTYDAI